MKNLILKSAILLVAFAASINLKASTKGIGKMDTLTCLQIDGRINNAEAGIDGECKVELISDNTILESIILKEGKRKFKFLLQKNTFYSIRVSKVGYVTKLVSVNTDLVDNGLELYDFCFETSLMPEASAVKLNEDILDFPVAIIQYDYEEEMFSYNKNYTAYIKKELHRSNPRRIQHNVPKSKYIQVLDVSDLASK